MYAMYAIHAIAYIGDIGDIHDIGDIDHQISYVVGTFICDNILKMLQLKNKLQIGICSQFIELNLIRFPVASNL